MPLLYTHERVAPLIHTMSPYSSVSSPYPHDLPFLYMRATMALMGALCAPMAYVTLKAIGQSTATAVAAATLVAFGKQALLARSITSVSIVRKRARL